MIFRPLPIGGEHAVSRLLIRFESPSKAGSPSDRDGRLVLLTYEIPLMLEMGVS